jgi:hypothetical protein
MTKWEYKVLVYPEFTKENPRPKGHTAEEFQEMLNRMGADGWEFIGNTTVLLVLRPHYPEGVAVGALNFKRQIE